MTRRLVKAATTVVMSLLLAAIIASLVLLTVVPRVMNGAALNVLTGSMRPGIPPGSIVIDRAVDTRTLQVGDIVTYQVAPGRAEYITHRIVAINTNTTPVTFTTKGDANRGADVNPVPATAIRGEVAFHLPFLGAIRDSIQSAGARSTAFVAVLVGLGLYAIFQLLSALRDRRRATRTGSGIAPAGDGA
ncbi:MAG: signal peptidase I [Candidatus Dormibacteria bacterium]